MGVSLLPNANELLAVVKKAAVEAVEATKPVNLCYGKVLSASPPKVDVEQKMHLGKNQLILLDMQPDLAAGDEVVLVRMQGGQKYLVVGRVKK